MIDLIAYIFVRILNVIFVIIPMSVALWFGRRIGDIAFLVNKKRRPVAYANLKSAFGAEKTPRELKAITKNVYRHLFETFAEILNLTKVNRAYIDKYVEVVNLDRIQDAARSGRGTILLTGHFGDWELSNLTSPMHGFPITVLVREQKMKRLNELLNRLRESKGCKVVRKGMSTKNILKALYAKEMVGILSDQDAGKNGMFVDFFGRPTSCHYGAFEIAKRTGALILPNFIVRTNGPYHKLHLEPYIDFRESNPSSNSGFDPELVEGPAGADDIRENLQKFVKLEESYIRKYPEQWLWLHKRWKSTPQKTVLVLNDGKAGHLNQSLSVASQIRKARQTQGYKPEETKIVIVDVKFKNKLSRTALGPCAGLASWRCHGCMGCMRACLDKGSYDTLMKTYSDFVVSCGSSLAAANIFMSIENNAKNIVIMKPNIPGALGKYKLAIIPKHDNPPKAKNVLVTSIAPNLIDKEKLAADGELLKKRVNLKSDRVIGLLMGGDNAEFNLTKDVAGKVVESLLKACDDLDAELVVTTSRRTSAAVETLVKDKFKNNPRCNLLVIANESNPTEALGGILALAKVVVVSGESISMVSEAISSGKKTVIFELEKKTPQITKYEWALKGLEGDGYLIIAKQGGLGKALDEAWKDSTPRRELKDPERIFEAVRRLI